MRKFGVIPGKGENSGSGFTECLLPTFFDQGAMAQYKVSNEPCSIAGLSTFDATKNLAHQVARVVWVKRKDGIWQRHPSVFRDAANRLVVLLAGGKYYKFASSREGSGIWSQAAERGLTVGNRHQIGAIFAKTG